MLLLRPILFVLAYHGVTLTGVPTFSFFLSLNHYGVSHHTVRLFKENTES